MAAGRYIVSSRKRQFDGGSFLGYACCVAEMSISFIVNQHVQPHATLTLCLLTYINVLLSQDYDCKMIAE